MLLTRPGWFRHVVTHLQPTASCQVVSTRSVLAAAKKPKPQKKKLRKPKAPVLPRIYVDYASDDNNEDSLSSSDSTVAVAPGATVPEAPATADQPAGISPHPEDLYPVFKPPQSSVSSISDGKWSWGDDKPSQSEQDVPMWNPKTGFMKTRSQAQTEHTPPTDPAGIDELRQAASSSSSSSPGQPPAATGADSQSSSTSSGFGRSSSSRSARVALVEPLPTASSSGSGATWLPSATATADLTSSNTDLPAVSREQVLGACFVTSVGMAAAAAGLHVFAHLQSASFLGTDQATIDQLLRIPSGLESTANVAYLFAAAAGVTASRFALLQVWLDLAEATERSNKQVLTPLSWPDVLFVSCLTGVTEEFLFRGGLIPATFPDYRGVLLSGVVFGLLHVTGGRNLAFAGWATAVGWLYGVVFVNTANIWVAAGAHSLSNLASAALWLTRSKGQHPQR